MKQDKEFLDGLRIQIENYLCKREKITDISIKNFEVMFNKMRGDYPELVGEMEAGEHVNAPHNKQHLITQRVVKWLEDQMKLDDSNK